MRSSRFITLWVCLVLMLVMASAWGDGAKTFPVSGTVLMPDGSPAVRASVEIWDLWKGWLTQTVASAQADASGRFDVSLPVGKYELHASSGMMVHMENEKIIEVKADGAVTGPTEIRLEKGALVLGSVIDISSGRFLSGVRVRSWGGDHAETGPDGCFRVLLPKGEESITAYLEGFAVRSIKIDTQLQNSMALLIETTPEGVLKGRVTDQAGKPIAGASIISSDRPYRFHEGKSDANGEYALRGLDPGSRASIGVQADGYENIWEKPVVFPQGQREVVMDFQLEVEKHRTISGRVTDHTGKPVKDAKVSYGGSDADVDYREVLTDADGRYTLAEVDRSNNIVLVRAKGFAPEFRYVKAGSGPVAADFDLQPGHSVGGSVVDEEGKAIEGVLICPAVFNDAMTMYFVAGGWGYQLFSQETTTDKEGRFTINDLPASGVFTDAVANGFARADAVSVKVDRTDNVIVLERPGCIRGTVLDAQTGKPIPEFTVKVNNSPTTFNTPDGRFSISGSDWTKGQKELITIQALGYIRAVLNSVEVRPASENDFERVKVRLKPAVSLEGTVRDGATGKFLEGVRVTIDAEGMASLAAVIYRTPEDWHPIMVFTDANGRFKAGGITSPRGRILLEKSGYGAVILKDVSLSGSFTGVMDTAASISGTALDKAGKPLPNASISIRYEGDSSFSNIKADVDGRFRVTGLPAGFYQVIHSGGGEWGSRCAELQLAAGQDYVVDWGRAHDVRVQGKVTRKGVPVAGVSVQASRVGAGSINAVGRTDKYGAFGISVIRPGEYRVYWTIGKYGEPGYIEVKKVTALKKGVTRLDAEIPAGSIAGQVIDRRTGKPVPNAKVRLFKWATEREEFGRADWYLQHTEPIWRPQKPVQADADGRFAVMDLTAGKWLVALAGDNAGGGADDTQSIELARDQDKRGIKLEVTEPGSAQIIPMDEATGKPAEKCLVVCRDAAGLAFFPDVSASQYKRTADGAMVFSGLPAGRYTVIAVSSQHPSASTTIEVKAGETAKAVVKLKTGGRIVFRINASDDVDVQSAPWLGYRISKPGDKEPVLMDYNGRTWGSVLNFEGENPREVYVPIEPGTYRVEAVLRANEADYSIGAGEDLWSGASTVKVEQGKDAVVEVRLMRRGDAQ